MTEVVNLFDVPRAAQDGDPRGYEVPHARIGPMVGANAIGLTVCELTEGNSVSPYHYEYPCEEWLIVLEGRPVLRDPDGEHELDPGDVVCFPPGPEGAHKVTNRRPEPALVAMLSSKATPFVVVYPDSDKIAVGSGDSDIDLVFPRSAAVDYWTGE